VFKLGKKAKKSSKKNNLKVLSKSLGRSAYKKKAKKSPVLKKTKVFLFAAFILAILIIITTIFLYSSQGFIGKAHFFECDTIDCFLEKANDCESASFTTKIGTTTILLEVSNDCLLKKEIIDLDMTEPEEVRNLFKGKSMICSYTKGYFDDDFVYQISGPLDDCRGSLVDTINEVI
jgi:hypothetical protein